MAKIREAEARELQRLKEQERALRFMKEEAEAERRAKFEEAAREKNDFGGKKKRGYEGRMKLGNANV